MSGQPHPLMLPAVGCCGLALAAGPRYGVDYRVTMADVEAGRVAPMHVERIAHAIEALRAP